MLDGPSATGRPEYVVHPPVIGEHRATAAFSVAEFKRECEAFLRSVSDALHSHGDDDREEEEAGLDVDNLCPPTEEEELELRRAAEPVQRPGTQAATPAGRPTSADAAGAEPAGPSTEVAAQAQPASSAGQQPSQQGASSAAGNNGGETESDTGSGGPRPADAEPRRTSHVRRARSFADEAGDGLRRASSSVPFRPRGIKAEALEAYQLEVAGIRRERKQRRLAAARVLRSAALAAAESAGAAPLSPPPVWGQSDRADAPPPRPPACVAPGGRPDLVPAGEVVLRVAVHAPHAPGRVSQEWLVLGRQPLSALRDAISCYADENARAVAAEENARRGASGELPLQLVKPSAFLYVEGTFYNDLRDPGAVDYSEPIRRHCRQHGVAAPPHPPPGGGPLTTEFSVARMEAARFDGLWLRLGEAGANLYCHQGGCEHYVTFADVRLFDPGSDPPCVSQYPHAAVRPIPRHVRDCEACGAAAATRVTHDDGATPHSPFFWCGPCFERVHYREDGTARRYDFRAFPYSGEYPPWVGGRVGGAWR